MSNGMYTVVLIFPNRVSDKVIEVRSTRKRSMISFCGLRKLEKRLSFGPAGR